MLWQAAAGRDFQGKRFGPRPLDLDIIAYGSDLSADINDEMLVIPHPRWAERDFVMAPLTDLYSLPELQALGLGAKGVLADAHQRWNQAGGDTLLLCRL